MKRHIEIINCFINAASADYHRKYGAPMVDEDLSMAFDQADAYATRDPDASNNQAHLAGHAYIASF